MKLTKTELRKRLLRSLAMGACFFLVLVSGFLAIQHTAVEDDVPPVLRKAFQFNQSIWAGIYSDKRLSPLEKKDLAGKAPRVNGLVGLEEPIDIAKYQLQVESGKQKFSLPLSAIQALPKVGYSTLFKCIEGWSAPIEYAGAKFSDFAEAYHVGKKADGSWYRYVGLATPDGKYYVSVDIDSMLHPQTVLAYEMNDRALAPKNGAPLRLVIPIKYGIKNLKRVGRIFFSDELPPDYWAEQGYDWWAGL